MRVITIGRSPKSDIVVYDASVSRIHLQIVVTDDGTCYGVDMNSTNGTFVNGQRISGKVRLQKNDVLRIGNMTLPWQSYIAQSAPIAHKSNVQWYVMAGTVLLLLAGAAWYFLNAGRADASWEPESAEMRRYENMVAERPVIKSFKSGKTKSGKKKPTEGSIPYDLAGHKLSEGVSDGYRRKDWAYTLEKTSITDFRIDEILEDNGSNYVIESSFHLKGGKNFYYDARARIGYVNKGGGWELDYVVSLGMTVVSDGKYDDCVVCGLADDGWGGVNCLSVRNTSEYPLAVGGKIRTDKGWVKFSLLVKAHDMGVVGGTFGGGNVQDYKIEFVVRE